MPLIDTECGNLMTIKRNERTKFNVTYQADGLARSVKSVP